MERTRLDVEAAWVFWAEILDHPYASEFVKGVNAATVALHHVYAHGFQIAEMQQWLRDWPTELGMQLHKEKCCLERAYRAKEKAA